ncbi:MAG: hypothetical protein MUC96_37950, partial [Myxococcaceae bacterium]|nr:hypothetical protein [Myxococcaceae bacterium]
RQVHGTGGEECPGRRRNHVGGNVSTDKKNTKALAQAFFAQLQSGGYTPNQILDIATELIDQVTVNLKQKPADVVAEPRAEA